MDLTRRANYSLKDTAGPNFTKAFYFAVNVTHLLAILYFSYFYGEIIRRLSVFLLVKEHLQQSS